MKKKDWAILIGVVILIALVVSLVTVNLTGNAIFRPNTNKCTTQGVTLSSNSPTKTFTFLDQGVRMKYVVGLVSASDVAATIKVENPKGVADQKEINEATSKDVNGLTILVSMADETNSLVKATIRVTYCGEPKVPTEDKVTYQGVLDMFGKCKKAYDISLTDASWDENSDGFISGNEVCKKEGSNCVISLLEYDNGGTAGKGLEPATCSNLNQIEQIQEGNIPKILDVWCCSP